jgi:hypothetical protein
MKLPNGDRADLGTKLTDYSLNPLHRHGQHKARVFESVLGITLANSEVLADALVGRRPVRRTQWPKGTTDSARFTCCVSR